MEINSTVLKPYFDALASSDPEAGLFRLILDLKHRGGSEQEARDLLYALKTKPVVFDTDDPKDDAICNVLDVVGGYCAYYCYIFSNDFDEAHFRKTFKIDA